MNLVLSDRPLSFFQTHPGLAEYIDLSRLRIANCVGCFGCWTRTPGRCVIRDDAVLVFPLYADSLPVPLLRLFKELEACPPCRRPAVSVVVNCGFLEPFQNDIAVEMVRLFCRRNGYPFAAALEIASGEAILDTPFRFLAGRALRRLARAIRRGEHRVFRVTMPLPKRVFLRASTAYWTAYGRRFGVSPRQMASMEIEPGPPSP